jgi:tRNA dimethylallyltransferase
MSSTADLVGAEPAVLRIIAGPTGAGKSALAMALAERHGARLLSADSRQIYRGFDLGTAKPSAAERARVPHAGIDVAEPTERWSAARWARAADEWLAEDARDGRPTIVVGGTGLWLQALVRPLAEEPPMDPARRLAVQQALRALDTEELRRWVQTLDPARAHLGRTQLTRAAEVALLSGTRLSDWHARHGTPTPRPARWLIVDPGPALQGRLDARRAAMLDAGWLDEVRSLVERVPADAPAWNACGYREIREVVLGTRAVASAVEAIRISTRQYAKRQRTWFRNQLQEVGAVTRLDPTSPDAAAVAEHWFSKGLS